MDAPPLPLYLRPQQDHPDFYNTDILAHEREYPDKVTIYHLLLQWGFEQARTLNRPVFILLERHSIVANPGDPLISLLSLQGSSLSATLQQYTDLINAAATFQFPRGGARINFACLYNNQMLFSVTGTTITPRWHNAYTPPTDENIAPVLDVSAIADNAEVAQLIATIARARGDEATANTILLQNQTNETAARTQYETAYAHFIDVRTREDVARLQALRRTSELRPPQVTFLLAPFDSSSTPSHQQNQHYTISLGYVIKNYGVTFPQFIFASEVDTTLNSSGDQENTYPTFRRGFSLRDNPSNPFWDTLPKPSDFSITPSPAAKALLKEACHFYYYTYYVPFKAAWENTLYTFLNEHTQCPNGQMILRTTLEKVTHTFQFSIHSLLSRQRRSFSPPDVMRSGLTAYLEEAFANNADRTALTEIFPQVGISDTFLNKLFLLEYTIDNPYSTVWTNLALVNPKVSEAHHQWCVSARRFVEEKVASISKPNPAASAPTPISEPTAVSDSTAPALDYDYWLLQILGTIIVACAIGQCFVILGSYGIAVSTVAQTVSMIVGLAVWLYYAPLLMSPFIPDRTDPIITLVKNSDTEQVAIPRIPTVRLAASVDNSSVSENTVPNTLDGRNRDTLAPSV